MYEYKDSGPIDCTASVNIDGLKGKTAIITGGASGIGKEYSRALTKAGAHVTIADLNQDLGKKVQQELGDTSTFVRCDVTSWKDQLATFKKAKEVSPTGEIDIVVANAGVGGSDQVWSQDIDKDEPEQPNISTTEINAIGVIWTTKLAMFYFQKQNASNKKDRLLILQSSLAGYIDLTASPQYNGSKFLVRGLLRSLRQSSLEHDIRVNLIAPWFIKTPITGGIDPLIEAAGVTYANVEDAAGGLMKLVSDNKIHDPCRAFAIVPRDWPGAPHGYVDANQDDFKEGTWMHKAQTDALKPMKHAMSLPQE